jgi:hypothetical protein
MRRSRSAPEPRAWAEEDAPPTTDVARADAVELGEDVAAGVAPRVAIDRATEFHDGDAAPIIFLERASRIGATMTAVKYPVPQSSSIVLSASSRSVKKRREGPERPVCAGRMDDSRAPVGLSFSRRTTLIAALGAPRCPSPR